MSVSRSALQPINLWWLRMPSNCLYVCVCVMINSDRVQCVWDLFNCTTDGCKACSGSRLKGDWPSTRNWQGEWCQSPNRPLYGVLGLFSLLLQSLVLVSIACFEEKRWSFQDILFTGLFAGKLVVSIATRQGHMHSSFRSTNLLHLPWPNPTLSGKTTIDKKRIQIPFKYCMSKQLGMSKTTFPE